MVWTVQALDRNVMASREEESLCIAKMFTQCTIFRVIVEMGTGEGRTILQFGTQPLLPVVVDDETVTLTVSIGKGDQGDVLGGKVKVCIGETVRLTESELVPATIRDELFALDGVLVFSWFILAVLVVVVAEVAFG